MHMKAKTNNKSSVAAQPIKLSASVPLLLFVAGVVLFLLAGIGWRQYVHLSTSNVFDGMLQQSLRTSSYTRTEVSSEQGVEQKTQSQVQFGADTFVRRLTTISQKIGDQTNQVRREAIGTLNADYDRLLSADFPSQPEAAKGYDKVKGVWVKAGGTKEAASNQVLLGSLFGILPMGYLTPEQQTELLNLLSSEKVYTVDKDAGITRSEVAGQEVYVYTVKIKQAGYIAYVQKFSEALGLGDYTQFDPNQYVSQPDIVAKFSVRPTSRQLVAVSFPDNPTRTESYSSYDVVAQLKEPDDTVSVEELQGAQR